jgi:APA family basic amino acid/polyamine antiporter
MSQQNNQLLKLLGIGFGIAITVGGTIGTGILRKPGLIASMIGNPTVILLLWLAVGIYALLGVMCVIELSISMPQAGAWYVYAKRAFGNYVGFVTGITSWLGTVAALGFGAYTFSEYVALLIPDTEGIIQLIAIGLLALITSLHLLGTKFSGGSQQVITLTNGISLLIFVCICFIFGQDPTGQAIQNTVRTTAGPVTMVGIISALQAIFYTYDGWHTASYFTEENDNPAKTMPRSMITGVILIIIMYLLINSAILYALPMDILSQSKLAAADTITYLFGAGYGKFITIFLMISILSIVNAQVMFAPRVIFSMGRDRLFFKQSTIVNKKGTPYLATLITTSLSVFLILSGKETCGILSDIATFFFVMSYIAGFAALIRMRHKEPELLRPYKVPLYPVLPWILIIVSCLFLAGAVYSDLNSSKYALIFLLVSYPIYIAIHKRQKD